MVERHQRTAAAYMRTRICRFRMQAPLRLRHHACMCMCIYAYVHMCMCICAYVHGHTRWDVRGMRCTMMRASRIVRDVCATHNVRSARRVRSVRYVFDLRMRKLRNLRNCVESVRCVCVSGLSRV